MNYADELVERAPGRAARRVNNVIQQATRLDEAGKENSARAALKSIEGLSLALSGSSRCQMCGRELTDDQSRARGIGPDCLAKNGSSNVERYLQAVRARPATNATRPADGDRGVKSFAGSP